jgi:hypothetical protein
MSEEVILRIVIQNSVDGTLYGLQKGKVPNYQTVQAQLGNGQDLTFSFTVQVKEASESLPKIAGPFVQGPAGKRFIYIGTGSYAGQPGASWSGRIKVPLSEAVFKNKLPLEGNSFLYCTVPGRNVDGKPVFATVKPFGGWFICKPPDPVGA